ncbi:MAG: CinA family protein [Actinomycetes bacterium]
MTNSDAAPDEGPAGAAELAEQVGELAQEKGLRVAAAESLTGGKITTHLAAAPSSASWFKGGVVAYAKEVKYDVLGVPEGPVVCEACARSMASGVAKLMGADAAVAVTGVGGPDEEEGQPVGTVWFGACVKGDVYAEQRTFDGDTEEILGATVERGLQLLIERVRAAD